MQSFGGYGAGGSIRIEAYEISTNDPFSVTASVGRIAIYRQYPTTSLTSVTSSPSAYTALLGEGPTAVPTSTPIDLNASELYGDGSDGDLAVASGATFYPNTQASSGRSCADMIYYSVTQLAESSATLSSAPPSTCLAAGDEILLIHVSGGAANIGKYEFLHVGGITGNIVYFTTPKLNSYGAAADNDASLGNVLIVRVPNYHDVEINGTLRAGLLFFKVKGTLNGSGTISAAGLGFGPASGYGPGAPGGTGASGGGGGYGTAGLQCAANPCGAGGAVYGEPKLDRLFYGSGGGAAGDGDSGGPGGGIIYIIGETVDFDGTITSAGSQIGWGGGGAGGSIRLEGNDLTLNVVTVAGGAGGAYGGLGRIAIYDYGSFSGNLTPGPGYLYSNPTATPTITATATLTRTPTATATSDIGLDNYTSALLHMDGADASTTFIDAKLKTWTAVGNAQIDTAQSKFGGASYLGDGNGDYLSTADSDDFSFTGTDVTIDFWVRPNSVTGSQGLFGQEGGSSYPANFAERVGTNIRWVVRKASGGNGDIVDITTSGVTLSVGTWYHLAFVKYANAYTIYINGIARGTATSATAVENVATAFLVGGRSTAIAVESFNGWIDEFRFSKGIARWTADFTPPGISYSATSTPTITPTATNPSDWQLRTYSYAGTEIAGTPYPQPHAVTSLTDGEVTNTYQYDENGNMTCRIEDGVTYKQNYNTENRISSISKMNGDCSSTTVVESWMFAYDGDGVRTTTAHDVGGNISTTRYYFGGAYEVAGTDIKKYYSFAGQTIAMKDANGLQYLLTDHLGSVVAITNDIGTLTSQQRYLPFGQLRADVTGLNGPSTDLSFTGQRDLGMGLLDYHARFYSPALGRFAQPDTLVPGTSNPQVWNRFGYVTNNPIRYNDPSGHCPETDAACIDQMASTLPVPGLSGKQKITSMHTSRGLRNLGVNLNKPSDVQSAMEIVVASEYGTGNYPLLDEAMTRRYHEYCSGAEASSRCIVSFWGYIEGILRAETPAGLADIITQTNAVRNTANVDVSGKTNTILYASTDPAWQSGCQDENNVEQLCHWATIDPGRNQHFYQNLRWIGGILPAVYYTYPTGYNGQLLIVLNEYQISAFCYEATGSENLCNLTDLK